jgi:CRISPR-associated protein Cas2
MYVLLVYDIEERRVAKALKTCRSYLHWVQNSVFEGEITEGKLKELLAKLGKIIDKKTDSVLIYKFPHKGLFEKQVEGREKSPTDVFL